ncbi:hypothetical protein DKP76_11905 [Falsochrobactrum shanghaiense]|uniref:DoxX family protein n=1 Tax=Falsochrobactrum shanghaiense TaxID=2201899 RepID=A0A316JQG3_9HYPH|nr:DoxX family protein [Falsochrobactrum shanghaiense]PWL17470.1 hypothetical protein DKP76_11905 [Falsochrobactrum shanghaiense]
MSTITPQTNGAVTLLSRILLSILFIPAGYAKLVALGGTSEYFASIGLPMPYVTAIIVALLEFVGGIAVLVGFQTRIAAVLLGLFTIGAAMIGHMIPFDQTGFLKNLAVAGGFFVLALHGAGSLSVDAKRG